MLDRCKVAEIFQPFAAVPGLALIGVASRDTSFKIKCVYGLRPESHT